MGCIFICSLQKRHSFSQDLQNKGYRMVPQKAGSLKILARSRNLGNICDRSGSLILHLRVLNFETKVSNLAFCTARRANASTRQERR